MKNEKKLEEMLFYLPQRLAKAIFNLPDNIKQNIYEIRLRSNLPLALTLCSKIAFINSNGQIQFFLSEEVIIVTQSELNETFKKLCNNSVYAHEDELKNGFISLNNGCRAGISGSITAERFIKNVTSINIRIAHQILGCADDIIKDYVSGGLLIAGSPCSGKTTVLRDLIRQLSNGYSGGFKRICVIDSRNEISATNDGITANDLGVNTDILLCQNKALGIEIALRTMFPDIIAFDEIGNLSELKTVSESFNSGVDIITTAHAGSINELFLRNVTSSLLKSGVISHVALLPKTHIQKIKLYKTSEILKYAMV